MFEKVKTLTMINDNKDGDPVKTQFTAKDPSKIKVKLNPLSGFIIWNLPPPGTGRMAAPSLYAANSTEFCKVYFSSFI